MKEVCPCCKFEKRYLATHCWCVKYGCPIKYGRTYCISYEPKEVREHEIRFGWDYIRQQEGGGPLGGTDGPAKSGSYQEPTAASSVRADPGTEGEREGGGEGR